MRDIRFRVWTGKEYRYPPMLWEADIGDLDRVSGYSNKITAIEQFTGLRDSKGQDLYEGDILKTDEAGWIAKVIWSYDGFMLTGLDNTGFSCSPNYAGCEVIGNIHEKPLDNGVPVA